MWGELECETGRTVDPESFSVTFPLFPFTVKVSRLPLGKGLPRDCFSREAELAFMNVGYRSRD